MAAQMPPDVQQMLKEASTTARTASVSRFACNICDSPWDQFITQWANRCYTFVLQALGPFQVEPLPTILPLSDGAHCSGANASFEPGSGQIRLSPSIVESNPGITLEKITHELIHASLAHFPEGDPFFEEGFVDYSTWVMAHAPAWGQYRKAMIDAAAYNIACRRDRAMKSLSEYDAKRWAGGTFAAQAYGPWIVTKDEFGPPGDVRITLRVNGETRQDSTTADLLFDCPTIIESLSAGLTLEPGDIICTGTPSGVGYAMQPPALLKDGDVVEAEVAGVGVLRNRVKAVA